jgi:hypothetical protein
MTKNSELEAFHENTTHFNSVRFPLHMCVCVYVRAQLVWWVGVVTSQPDLQLIGTTVCCCDDAATTSLAHDIFMQQYKT